jgi:predicted RNase H-like HicB family nuclease
VGARRDGGIEHVHAGRLKHPLIDSESASPFCAILGRRTQVLKSYLFKVVIEEDQHEDGRRAYQAYCPEIEEAVTWGDTPEEALQRINELLQALVQMRIEEGRKIPTALELESSAVVVTV